MFDINPRILCRALSTSRLKVTNSKLIEQREVLRSPIVEKLSSDFHSSFRSLHTDMDRGIKLLNHFYLFNGLNKYYENLRQQHDAGLIKLSEAELKMVDEHIKILAYSQGRKDSDLIKVLNCNPQWPICLFDFTQKN